jgi:acyl-CoA thioester hydrolase
MTTAKTPTLYIHRVCYSDTDAAGFVYHGRYLEIFERSRAHWLAQRDLTPTILINDYGILLPVRELSMHFYKPGRLDDLL